MHHKRKRPKNRRAGCLMCKPWKMNGARPTRYVQHPNDRRADDREREQRNATR